MNKFSTRTRALTGAAVAVVLAAGTFGVVSAASADSQAAPAEITSAASDNVTQSSHLTVEAATAAAQAAMDAAAAEDQRVSVAVVDRNGNTIVTLRGDGSGPQSPESAVKKAFTAVAWNAPTSELVERLEQTPNLKDIPGTLFLGGGAPIASDDAPIAGIGVAGAPTGDLDQKFAQAGADALDE